MTHYPSPITESHSDVSNILLGDRPKIRCKCTSEGGWRSLTWQEQTTEKTTGQSLLDLFDSITADMTEAEISHLPHDAAAQHDQYRAILWAKL